MSALAKAAIGARALPLADALAQLVAAAAGDPVQACGGLYVLTQDHAPLKLLPPFVAAVLGGEAGPSALAERAGAMAMPLGWLVCRCDDRRAAQLALLGAVGNVVGAKAALLPQTAPLLKALWEAEVVDEAVVAEWAKADGGGGKAQRWAQPFVDGLREVPEAEAETE